MEIRFLDVVQQEFDEAVDDYKAESPGIGGEFLLDALDALERVRQFPHAWHAYREQPAVSDATVSLRHRLPNS
jgi:hypothetical protein